MRAIIVLVVLGLTATSVLSTCAAANAWQDLVVGTTGSTLLSSEVNVATAGTNSVADGVTKCAFVTTVGSETKVCVTDQTHLYASIQKYIDNTKGTLQDAAAVRDAYIIAQRGEVVKIFSSLRRLNELADGDSSVSIPAAYATIAGDFVDYADEIASNFTAIVEAFDTYQDNRATCMNALLAAQAAILCNSFVDGTTAGMTKTDGSEALTIDDTLLASLSTACYPYIQNSATQSTIISTSVYKNGIASLVSGIEKLVNGDTTGATEDLVSAWTSFGTASISSTNAQKPVTLPTECTSATACQAYIDSDWFVTGVLANDAIVRGGDITTFTFSRVLSEGKERRLAGTGMTATLASYGFTYGFEKNPGDVDNTENSKSALRNGIVAVAVAALALVF